MFYTRVPAIYTSSVATDNGLSQTHLFLENTQIADSKIFPVYPFPLVNCPAGITTCLVPDGLAGKLTSEVSAFSPQFQTPYVQQASMTLEKEIGSNDAISASYLLRPWRAHDPRARYQPADTDNGPTYPVFSEDQNTFTAKLRARSHRSARGRRTRVSCPFPPCVNDVRAPFRSWARSTSSKAKPSSIYHGLTISARRG